MSVSTRRIARMERQHGRFKKQASFNIVSLMDIFTILVFFLLINTSDITPLPNPKGIEIPESIAETRPHESVVVMLSSEGIRLQGEEVITVEEIMSLPPVESIDPGELANYSTEVSYFVGVLQELANEVAPVSQEDPEREVTIMGDRKVPYKVLDRVMRLCADFAGFSKISLSVIQKETQLDS